VVHEIGKNAWSFLTKSDEERSWSANQGYDDVVDVHYSYDSHVPNCQRVAVGDIAIVRANDWVAGWGVIEFIEVTPNALKEIHRCPNCNTTNHRSRQRLTPKNLCNLCAHGFSDEEMIIGFEVVTNYRAYYANTWVEAARPVDFHELAALQRSSGTFNAIRPIETDRLPEFLARLSGRDVDLHSDIPDAEITVILGGHTEGIVRRRRGQREFRFKLMERFGENCAFSGPQPPQVLEAAHLYSYALKPEHRVDGGLLLRRDYHSLFDAKLLAVNPSSFKIELAPRLSSFESYRNLEGRPLRVDTDRLPSIDLLADHYEQAQRIFAHN
jgi:hypothetical protein